MDDLQRYYGDVVEEGELNITFDIMEREHSWSRQRFASQIRQDAMAGILILYRYGSSNEAIDVDPWSVDLTSDEVLRGLCFSPTDAAWEQYSESRRREPVK